MYPRGEKESHLDTIRYEIDMLRYSLKRWRETDLGFDPGDRNAFLECFLLHYRILVEFLSGRKNKQTDLVVSSPKVWMPMRRVDQRETSSLQKRGRALRDRYHDKISKFLQHCTEARADIGQEWHPEKMYDEIQESLSEFEKRFVDRAAVGSVDVRVASPADEGCHTATFKRIT